jgi:hypothetical protein
MLLISELYAKRASVPPMSALQSNGGRPDEDYYVSKL